MACSVSIMKRVVIPELLDTDSGTPAEIANALSDLRNINQWFGGVDTTQSMISEVARKMSASSLSMLEVAAGAGYVPLSARARLRESGLKLQVTLLDRAHSHLNKNGNSAVAGDAPSRSINEPKILTCSRRASSRRPKSQL